MYFVDSSGHPFHQTSFNYEPIGYEYYKNKYVFWIDNKDHSYCSINNYYIRPIYILSDTKLVSLKIVIDSNVFSLISSRTVNDKFVGGELSIDEWELDYELNYDQAWVGNEDLEPSEDETININDILELEVTSSETETIEEVDENDNVTNKTVNKTKYIYPFYVIGNSPEVGAIFTNILIRAEYETEYDYCYITVGGEFNEENEILYINGRNMGVELPAEIIRGVYNGSYVNGEFDEVLYNEKLKEYLIEYMQIRGQVGNYNSAIQSLKWFGWGNHVELVSLLQTDNQFMEQFVRDFFDTDSDILDSFKYFINTTLLSLIVWENKETGEYYDYDLDADFIGENQPILEDLFSKQVAVKYGGVGEETYYYKNYYNFMFSEMLYKIAALKYYYEKYFLPVHLSVHNASLHHKVYANDIKMLFNATEHVTEPIVKIGLWDDPWVEFPKNNEIWLTEQVHYVDELFNEWNFSDLDTYAENKDIYYIHDTCCNIPIKFLNYTTNDEGNIVYKDEQVNVHLILEKITSEADNTLYLNYPINFNNDIIHIYDITGREIDLNNTRISYSVDDGATYSTFCYGIDSLKEIITTDNTIIVNLQFNDNEKYEFEYEGETYTIQDEPQYIEFGEDKIEKILYIPGINDIHIDVFNNSAECSIIEYHTIQLKIRITNDKINSCIVEHQNNATTDITDDITIMYSPSSEIFYESDFTFNGAYDEYNDLVIYPKMFNNVLTDKSVNRHGNKLTDRNIDITYFINGKFRLRMLINNQWHSYEFTIRMPDINIEFGKLIYKYYDDELKYSTKFNQLSYLSNDTLQFNAFMHEPRMTRINDINFLENFLKYINISTARYIDGSVIPTNEFCQYIDIKITEDGETYSQRIYISNNNYGQDLIIPRKYFNYDVLFYLFLDERLLYIFADTGNNNTYEILGINDSALIYDNFETDDLTYNLDDFYNDTNNYKHFVFNPVTNKYEVETAKGVREFPVKETLRSDVNSLAQKYIETHNITNKYKYLNQVHVYDLYRLNDHSGDNILRLQSNIDMHYHGIRFTHKSFLEENHIHISGYSYNLINSTDPRTNDNITHNSSLDPNDTDTIYDSYINTYDDLTIYSAYEGDWLEPMTMNIDPSGFVYYEEIDNGVPSGVYTTNSISVVGHEVDVKCKTDDTDNVYDYVDVATFEDFNELLNNCKIIVNDDEYVVDIEEDGQLFINKDNINSQRMPVHYTAQIVRKIRNTTDSTIINPTYSDYYNIIRPYFNGDDMSNEQVTYELRIKFFITENSIENNIQRIYTGDAEYSNGVYTAIIGGQIITLTPFYSEYDQNYDTKFKTRSLIQQPGFDWIDIYDLDNTIQYINYNDENDYISISKITDEPDDSDIEHLLSYRKLLILNVSTRLINSIKNYEDTNIYDDLVTNYKHNPDDNIINIKFKITSNQQQDDGITIKTILRAKYIENDTEGYDYFEDEFNINAKIKEDYHIDCEKSSEELFINHYTDDSVKKYVDFVAFFVIVPDEINDEYFEIDINPDIRLVYKDYDLLEYPTDSFIKVDDNFLNYETDDYVDYTINDIHYKYGDCRESAQVVKLYNEFFKERTISYNDIFSFTSIDAVDELNIDKNLVEYDMYLMHDLKNWYIVYISKDTCDKSLALYDYEIDNDHNEIVFVSSENKQYKLIRNVSVKKFLINRYVYSSKNGRNHFATDDIIVGKVLNNERLPIDVFKSSKWEISPVSFALDKQTHTSSSNIDMCIFDVPMYNDEYVKGYYDVTYRYSLDRISTQQYKKYGTICVE